MIIFGVDYSIGRTWGPVGVSDSFVIPKNKVGAGSGEAKLYVGKLPDPELRSYFGPELFSASCVMLKAELIEFMDAIHSEYENPTQDYLHSAELPQLWTDRRSSIAQLPDEVEFQIEEQSAGGDRRCFVKGQGMFSLLRELPLPRRTNVTFTEIVAANGDVRQLVRLHLKVSSDVIRYWQVQHDATGIEAESLGVLWSPQQTKSGASSKWYSNMKDVQVGDRVYSYRGGKIQAVGLVTDIAVPEQSPFANGESDTEGWLVGVNFYSMPNPFSPTEHYESISKVMTEMDKTSIRAPGETAIIGYLKEISAGVAGIYDVIGGIDDIDFDDEYQGDGKLKKVNIFEELGKQLLLPPVFLAEISELLDDKKQVIFYGPPGTGKTYIAMKIAEFLSDGNVDKKSVEIVQFHPSYAYEDFVEGFRPTEAGNFKLVDGKLLSIAKRATDNPNTKFFLIIDEINRGNIAKIFGEMYFLLEYRDRDIQLQYSDKAFKMPENLYFIGTMNSADRSIGLIDSALRRRFHFVSFYPTEKVMKDLLRNWLKKNAPDVVWIADAIDEVNSKIDRNFAVGPSHFMKSNLNESLARKVWNRSILPYLEDIFFNQQSKVDEFRLENLRTLKRIEQDYLAVENVDPQDDSASAAS